MIMLKDNWRLSKINIVGLVTKVFPKLEEVIKYDYIYVLDDTEKLDYVNESEYLMIII